MPNLLRYDAIRLFEASVENLHLAVLGLGGAKRTIFRQPAAQFAPEIGLIGACVELAMSGCLVHAFGPSILLWPSGQYKTGGQILSEFRGFIKGARANSEFIVQGVDSPDDHRKMLIESTSSFKVLFTMRAGGLHAGRGLIHEATAFQLNLVADFLEFLGKSSRIHPYLNQIPRCLCYSRNRTIIVEDLSRRLKESSEGDKASLLSSIYLVLPDVPENQPEWLEALERVSIAPKERDIEYLLGILETAVPASLRRASKSGEGIPVVVRPEDPNALPISPHYLRRQLSEIPDLWNADIGTANGRLVAGCLDLPPEEAVREIMALGFERSGILKEDQMFTAHESWAPIMASLGYIGTPGPYWFLVRRTSELGQLKARLSKASKLLKRAKKRVDECNAGLDSIINDSKIKKENIFFDPIIKDIDSSEKKRNRLMDNYRRTEIDISKALPLELEKEIEAVSDGGQPVGPLILNLLEHESISDPALKYWARILAESSSDADDIPALVAVLNKEEAGAAAHTAARKAIRRIDFRLYGPAVDLS